MTVIALQAMQERRELLLHDYLIILGHLQEVDHWLALLARPSDPDEPEKPEEPDS